MNDGALSGLKVLEYGDFISAPYCGKLLADLGADVIKVEPPTGDSARQRGPFPKDIPHPEKSGLYLYLNTNKRGVTLNLQSAAGKKAFYELAKWADVLIENYTPKEAKKLGIDYKTLHKLNPALVVTSITYFGQTGRYKDYKGTDLIGVNMSGEAFANPAYEVYNTDHNPPLKLPGHAGDFLGGLNGAMCAMSAVFMQQATGVGQQVDLSIQEALAAMVCHEVGDYYDADVRYLRNREDRWEHSPKLACKDGYIMMNIPDQFWAPLMDMLGNPEWSKEEKYQTAVGRHFNLRDSQPHVIEWMKTHSVYEVEKLAKEKRLPFSIVRTMKEVSADKLFVERNYFVDVDHKVAGKIRFPGAPCQFSATPGKIRHAAPLLGEHNAEVFGQILGYTPEKMVKMQQAGAI